MSFHLFLYAVAAVALWLASLYLHPFGACLRCRGQGHLIRGSKRKPKAVTCPRCKGAARCQRFASKTVHQLARRVRRYRQHQARLTERTPSHADRNL